ncbi:MAG: hypothetical protein ACE5R4_17215 [Armatimonadota bacterium]
MARVIPALVMLAVLLLLAVSGVGQDWAQGLRARDLGERLAARDATRTAHRELVDSLLVLAREETEADPAGETRHGVPVHTEHEPKQVAIELLGELRAPKAVPVLYANLTYCNPPSRTSALLTWHYDFPAAVSLSQIGKPAVGPALAHLASSDDELERDLCCWIIEQVEGKQLAPIVLQLAVDKEQYSGRKKRLQAALDYLQKQE